MYYKKIICISLNGIIIIFLITYYKNISFRIWPGKHDSLYDAI